MGQVETAKRRRRAGRRAGEWIVGAVALAALSFGPCAPQAWAAGKAGNAGRAGEWRTVGGDSANTRFSPLTQITPANVGTLGGVWKIKLRSGTRTPPVMTNGRLFINDKTTVYALDPATGRTIWDYTPPGSTPARGGVAVAGGLVYVGLTDTHVIALDEATGRLAWTGYIGDRPPAEAGQGARVTYSDAQPSFDPKIGYISTAPTYVNGRVVIGVSGGDSGARGKVAALDARTGRLLWSFNVVPTAGSPGAESWGPDPAALDRGGGSIWSPGAADPGLGLVYYGTGNAVAMAAGELRPGDNLYTSSVIALDVATGALKWHFQLTHHEIWDQDVATPIVLYTATVAGKPRPALAVARTDGYLFLLDRRTGAPVFPVEERPVPQDASLATAPTQPFPVGADSLAPRCATEETAPKHFRLGCYFDPINHHNSEVLTPFGTMRQAPMSYNPANGYFYAMGGVHPFWYRRMKDPLAVSVSHPVGATQYGVFAAIDSRTNRIIWQKRSPWDLMIGSGALTTAGGLLFHMEADGNFHAHDANSGKSLWRFQTGALSVPGPGGTTSGVPAASYAVKGRQYVVAPMGNWLWAFALGGPLTEAEAPTPPSRVTGFTGIIRALPADGTGEIIVGMGSNAEWNTQGDAFVPDESGIIPPRASIKAGAEFTWTNRGAATHVIAAQDGSWKTGPIAPGQSVRMKIDKAGSYVFSTMETPWSVGQLVVR